MLRKFFRSNFFEKKFINLRRKSSFIDKKYRLAHGVGKAFESEELKKKSENAIRLLKEACITSYEGSDNAKIIWMYWDSHIEDAPEVVQLSYISWKKLNPDYKVVLLNDENIERKLGFEFNAVFDLCKIRLTKANKSDLLRTYLLTKFGGIWADATSFCIKPLKQWLPNIKDQTDFFMFRQKEVKSRPLEVWFMYAEKGSPVIAKTFFLYLDFLLKDRDVTIFVSNSKKMMRKLGFEKSYPYRIYAESVYDAERYGFMPYFALAYFLNESMNTSLDDFEQEKFFRLPNKFCNNQDPIDCFLNSYVSKQTYKNGYPTSDLYLERKELLVSNILVKTEI